MPTRPEPTAIGARSPYRGRIENADVLKVAEFYRVSGARWVADARLHSLFATQRACGRGAFSIPGPGCCRIGAVTTRKEKRKNRKAKPKKPPLGYRIGTRLRATGQFGRDAVRSPGSLPGKAHGFFRRWFRKVWSVRGGGLYAVGYAITFLFWEVRTLAGDIFDSDGVGDFVTEQVMEILLRFAGDTINNMVHAFIWPVYVIELHPVYGGVALGLAFWLFPKYLKGPIERWMFADD